MKTATRRVPRRWSAPSWWVILLLALLSGRPGNTQQVITAPGGGCAATPYPICVAQEGQVEGNAKKFNFTGAGVDCTFVGSTAEYTCDFSGGGGGGTAVALDLADNGVNESSALTEIATTGDTNSIFTEPSPNKLLVNVGMDWPVADLAQEITCTSCVSDAELLNSYSGVGACGGNQYVHTLNDNAAPTCAQLTVAQLAATCTDAQVVGGNLAGTGLECQTDVGGGGSGTVTSITCDASLVCTAVNPIVAAGTISRAALTGDVTASAGANATTIAANAVALSTDTTGDYVSTATTSQGLLVTGTEGASVGLIDCAANQVLKRNAGDTAWACAADDAAPANYVATVADGTGIDGTASGAGSTYTPVLDLTEIDNTTWSDGVAALQHTFDLSPNDQVVTYSPSGISFGTAGTGGNNLIVTNTNSGNAFLQATATVGDAYSRYTLAGPVNWVTGAIDASDKYSISSGGVLGTNEVFGCTTAGVCAFPDPDGVTFAGPVTLTGEATGCAEFTAGGVLNGTGVACGSGGSGYATIQDEAAGLTARTTVNFTGAGVTCVDNAGATRTDCTISGGGGGVSDGDKGDVIVTGSGATWTIEGTVRASSTVCSGTSDASATVEAELVAATAANKSYFLPSGCKVGLGSPGAGNAAVDVPANAKILCEDGTAGFFAQRQSCVGGTYPGAACNVDADCLGGGACDHSFGTTSANPCTGTECFAPAGGSTYTMLKDAAPGAGIEITNCGFWTYQADGFQRCSTGATPCRLECSGPGGFTGARCETDADCAGLGSGTCTNRLDCDAGTCTAAPLASSGSVTAKINPLDLARTASAKIVNVKIYDHFSGDFGISNGYYGYYANVNTAAEISDCTTSLTATPAASLCRAASAGACCYGALNFASSNTQPTVAVTNGLVLGGSTQLFTARVRGATAAISAGDDGTIHDATVIPHQAQGPGTASAGLVTTARGIVTDAAALFLKAGVTGVTVGTNATVRGVRLGGAHTTGIVIGQSSTADANIVAGASMTLGIDVAGLTQTHGNTLTMTATNSIGIRANNASAPHITNNTITASGVPANQVGVQITGTTGTALVESNDFMFSTQEQLPTTNQVGIEITGWGSQSRYNFNYFGGGWRGINQLVGSGALTNSQAIGNRFMSLTGAATAVGGAGYMFMGNYVNPGGITRESLVCDATCSNGGEQCQQDSDCTACSGSVTNECIPEPFVAFVGEPHTSTAPSSSHHAYEQNIAFAAGNFTTAGITQCGGTAPTSPGALCETAVAACGGGGACTGGSEPKKTCVGGTEANKLCCTGGGAQTCALRTPTPYFRISEGTAATSHNLLSINSNKIFSGAAVTELVGIDMVNSASIGTLVVDGSFSNNQFDGTDGPNTVGIKFPTTGTFDVQVAGNLFRRTAQDVTNAKGTYGQISFVPTQIALAADQASTSTSLADVTALRFPIGANRTYKMYCHFLWTTAAATTGLGLAINGPAGGTVAGRIGICDSTASCLTAGASNYRELHVNAYDTALTTTDVPGAVGTLRGAVMEFIVVNGATAGTLAARFATEVAASTATLKAGSNCEVQQFARGS